MTNQIPYSKRKVIPRHAWDLLRAASEQISEVAPWQQAYQAFCQFHRPAAKKYPADFQSSVQGIPCGVYIETFTQATRPTREEPGVPLEITYFLLHKTGSRNHWLESKQTPADITRIEAEIASFMQELKDEY